MYIVVNLRWSMIHVWLGREKEPSLETGVLVVSPFASQTTGVGTSDGCWSWGQMTPFVTQSAVRFMIPAIVVALAKVVVQTTSRLARKPVNRRGSEVQAYSDLQGKTTRGHFKNIEYEEPQTAVHELSGKESNHSPIRSRLGMRGAASLDARCGGSRQPRSRACQIGSKRGLQTSHLKHERTRRLMGTLLLSLTTIIGMFIVTLHPFGKGYLRLKSQGRENLEAPIWAAAAGAALLQAYIRQHTGQWPSLPGVDIRQPFVKKVMLLRPFGQSSYGILPLYDHFPRRFNISVTFYGNSIIAFTTARKWEIIRPTQHCRDGNIFVFSRIDKFAAFFFPDQDMAEKPMEMRAMLPSQITSSSCSE